MNARESSFEIRLASKVAARTSHDLNNVAEVLSGHVFLLRSRAEALEEGLEAMEKAVNHVERLARSLGILGAVGLEEEALLDLNEIAHAQARDPSNGGRAPRLDLGQDLPSLRGRPSDVRQAVRALVTNAREATAPGEEIKISTRYLAEAAAVTLAVEDSGEGIAPEIRRKVLEPLFSTKGEKGRGMGLTLAVAVAALHDGSCEVEQRPDGGTRVTLRFPLAPRGRSPA